MTRQNAIAVGGTPTATATGDDLWREVSSTETHLITSPPKTQPQNGNGNGKLPFTLQYADVDAERAVLAVLLIDPQSVDDIRSILDVEDFQIVRHRWIYQAILDVVDAGDLPDFVTVTDAMRAAGRIKTPDEANEIYDLVIFDAAPNILNGLAYAQVVKHASIVAQAFSAAQEIARAARPDNPVLTDDLVELGARLQELGNVKGSTAGTKGSTWGDLSRVIGPITWAWKPWLPDGMLTLIASEPGIGKSGLCLRIAGCFVKGWDWPDGTPFTGQRGRVLWCEAEAGQALNLERATSWGFPADDILSPLDDPTEDVNLDNPRHRQAIYNLAHRDDIRLIVIDSLRGSHGGSEKDTEIIGVVKWMAQVARDTGKPFLLTHHLRKRGLFDGNEISLDRLRGSTAIVQPARLVWAMDTPDPNAKDTKRLAVIKSNLARFPDPLGMTLDDKGVVFCDAPEPPKPDSVVDKAADLLLSLLRREPMNADDVLHEFDQVGLSHPAAKRAKKRLGIVSVKQADGRWYWSLPAKQAEMTLQ